MHGYLNQREAAMKSNLHNIFIINGIVHFVFELMDTLGLLKLPNRGRLLTLNESILR